MSDPVTGVEPEGVSASAIGAVVAVSIVVVIVLVSASWVISEHRFKQIDFEVTEISGYPLKQETEASGRALLMGYERLDDESNIYRIPIERAMELVVEESTR
ncbi:MAG: hypothetical protein COV99_01365 [Bacteroidetes bacterium CG12_big_fil_rev_8_21_14_0_65_60_17]|nr:MAG: hypothetical protein COV99_01365 [Bacteroidetes bacterium CG12_big_fil_rev_8_21_14_0_65_60_17]